MIPPAKSMRMLFAGAIMHFFFFFFGVLGGGRYPRWDKVYIVHTEKICARKH